MQETKKRVSNSVRSESMRAELIASARRLFVEKSYGETSTPEIVEAAGVTRGALYHHFEDKKALFRAVVEQEAAQARAAIDAVTISGNAREMLAAGGEAFLKAMKAPGRIRLLLLDGPAILGRSEMELIDARQAGGALREVLAAAAQEGLLARALPLDAAAKLLSGLYDRAALAMAEEEDADAYRTALTMIVDGLFVRAEG